MMNNDVHASVIFCSLEIVVYCFVLLFIIVERYVSKVFYSERKIRVFCSQSDKILGVIYPK